MCNACRVVMTLRFEFDVEHRILLVLFEGDIRDSDVADIRDLAESYVDRLQPRAGIADLSGVRNLAVSGNAMRAAGGRSSSPREIVRFIVAPQDHMFGMARMYELSEGMDPASLHVVRTRAEALATLGVPDAKFEPIRDP
jgi:hypothetical protein